MKAWSILSQTCEPHITRWIGANMVSSFAQNGKVFNFPIKMWPLTGASIAKNWVAWKRQASVPDVVKRKNLLDGVQNQTSNLVLSPVTGGSSLCLNFNPMTSVEHRPWHGWSKSSSPFVNRHSEKGSVQKACNHANEIHGLSIYGSLSEIPWIGIIESKWEFTQLSPGKHLLWLIIGASDMSNKCENVIFKQALLKRNFARIAYVIIL